MTGGRRKREREREGSGDPTSLKAAKVFVAALGIVALGDDGRDIATGLRVTGKSRDSRHPSGVLGVQLVEESATRYRIESSGACGFICKCC